MNRPPASPTLRLRSIVLAIALETACVAAIAAVPRSTSLETEHRVSIRSERSLATDPIPEAIEPEETEPVVPLEPLPIRVPTPTAPNPDPSFDAEPELETPNVDDAAPAWDANALAKLTRDSEPTIDQPPAIPDASTEAPPIQPAAPKPVPERPATPEPLDGWNDPPLYPARARRLGQEGSAVFTIVVDKNGLVEQLVLVTSTGHRLLDLAAERALRRWRFDRGPASFEWTIEFRLDGGVRDRTRDG
ncbi:MAG: energy transducer TonB [Planctomycetes bacterium]|nr:energy transducer TonB [Planctomycetota bacterium]